MDEGFVLHGDIAWSEDKDTIITKKDAYAVCLNGVSMGVYDELPDKYLNLPVDDHDDRLIIPGMTDLHVHAPQFQFRGLGTDMELLEWLESMAFPEESRYADLMYAKRAYDYFVEDLYIGATTRAAVFATKHTDATLELMDMLEETGLVSCVGKVNMDRNVPGYYVESTESSISETRRWLNEAEGRYERTYPILTPRFTPACSRELMNALGDLASEYGGLPVQSHISENPAECEWVKELEKDCASYAETYDRAGLFGTRGGCIMAHAVYSPDDELSLMKKNGVFIAHCPQSNTNLSSGIAPVRRYLDEGLSVGLGSDVAGGSVTNLFTAMKDALQASKLRWRLADSSLKPLTFENVFYMATKGGGAFFGRAGSFEAGYEFDAVVLDDSNQDTMRDLTTKERLERLMYFADDRNIQGKYVRGSRLY